MRINLSIIAVFVLGLGVLTGCNSSAAPATTERAAATNEAPKSAGQMDEAPRINLADAKKDFDAGNAVFVDTRGEEAFKQERIKGAINVPMEYVEQRYKNIPEGKKIIVYCS